MLFLSLPFQCCVYKEKRAPITMYVDIYVKLIRELGGGQGTFDVPLQGGEWGLIS